MQQNELRQVPLWSARCATAPPQASDLSAGERCVEVALEVAGEQASGWSLRRPAPFIRRRAHLSPRHACALHRVLFLRYLRTGQQQAQQGCRGH